MAIRMEKATSSPRAPDAVLDLSACTGSRSEEMGQRAGDTLMSPRSTEAPQAGHGTLDGSTTHSPHSPHRQIRHGQGGRVWKRQVVLMRGNPGVGKGKWRRRRRRRRGRVEEEGRGGGGTGRRISPVGSRR